VHCGRNRKCRSAFYGSQLRVRGAEALIDGTNPQK
jgi:hypothetical protein